jgi:RND family efflux transporter MFP subunit
MLRVLTKIGKGAAWLVVLAIVIVLTGFGGHKVLFARTDSSVAARPLPVAVMEIRHQETYQQRRLFAGRIAAAQVADAGFQVGGEVAEVLVETGDRVEKGAPLATLDPLRLDLRSREAEAQLSEARALLVRSEATWRRVADLADQGFATEQELDDALADRNGARARVRLLERTFARAEEDTNDTVLTAPFAGYVVGRYVDAGATVSSGQPVVRINQQAALEAEIGVPMELASTVGVGDRFDLIANDVTASGLVEGVSDDVDPATRSRLIRLRVEEDPGLIPGGLVRLALSQERQGRGVWVPMTALQEGYRGLWSVYIVDAENTIRRKDVEIVSLADDQAFVAGTLEDGDRVVTTSPFRFVPGQTVEIVKTEPVSTPVTAAAASVLR